MLALPVDTIAGPLRPTATYAAALVHAIARDEGAGRRPARLTEPGLPTWNRFRGRLDEADLVRLLLEDAAVIHPVPFNPAKLGGPLRLESLPAALARTWLDAIPELDLSDPGPDYVIAQARLLGLPTRLARSELHVVKPHQKVLELPGTGGQLAYHMASTQDGVTLHDNVTVACGSWQELALAGVVALDLAAPHTDFAVKAGVADLRDPDHPIRQQRFDFVVGLHPDKGGLLRAEDQLAIWFSGATILLV